MPCGGGGIKEAELFSEHVETEAHPIYGIHSVPPLHPNQGLGPLALNKKLTIL